MLQDFSYFILHLHVSFAQTPCYSICGRSRDGAEDIKASYGSKQADWQTQDTLEDWNRPCKWKIKGQQPDPLERAVGLLD